VATVEDKNIQFGQTDGTVQSLMGDGREIKTRMKPTAETDLETKHKAINGNKIHPHVAIRGAVRKDDLGHVIGLHDLDLETVLNGQDQQKGVSQETLVAGLKVVIETKEGTVTMINIAYSQNC